MTEPRVVAVCSGASHSFSKPPQESIELLAGLGVAGDAHCGATVQHLSRVRRDPTQPNLRQVHLVHAELHDELTAAGFDVGPGDMGENLTTRGLALLDLPTGTVLHIGEQVVLELTGLRNPCVQLDRFQHGLMSAVLERDAAGGLVRKAGVMAVVRTGGRVQPDAPIAVRLPVGRPQPLTPV